MLSNEICRRDFIVASFGLGLSSTLKASRSETVIPVIDAHQHLWDISKFKLPWLPNDGVLARSYSIDDYKKHTQGLNIVNTVYMEVDVDPSQQLLEAEDVSRLCQVPDSRMKGAVISGRPGSRQFKEYISKISTLNGIKGLRQVLHVPTTPPGFCLSNDFIEGVRLLGSKGLSFDLCVKHSELGNVSLLIDECPDTVFILDHCGNPDLKEKDLSPWKRGLESVAKRKNVVCKVSGFLASAPAFGKWSIEQIAPIVNYTLDIFGPDRVMFAGDWPVVLLAASFADWIGAVRQIVSSRPTLDQKKLFFENAVKYYKLKI